MDHHEPHAEPTQKRHTAGDAAGCGQRRIWISEHPGKRWAEAADARRGRMPVPQHVELIHHRGVSAASPPVEGQLDHGARRLRREPGERFSVAGALILGECDDADRHRKSFQENP